jgi:hypothetical protein
MSWLSICFIVSRATPRINEDRGAAEEESRDVGGGELPAMFATVTRSAALGRGDLF